MGRGMGMGGRDRHWFGDLVLMGEVLNCYGVEL